MTSEQQDLTPTPLGEYHSILVAVDASDLSNRGVVEAAALGRLWGSAVTGAHVYAAKMHDLRFRAMEGGLPEKYREEEELERQRDVHDNLITKGLGVITDSYLDQAEETCRRAELSYRRCSLEGKNYREMTREANSTKYDLLVLGAQGLGAVPGARLGTVCRRVVRRSAIDTLVIKDATNDLASGPVVAAVDGSARAYGGLLSALALAREWDVAVHVVSAYDPYYHYVAFNRIAKVLSAEAGRVFRFEEQEKLHEDIIDAGLAKIYQGHLDVSRSIAADYGVEVVTELLDGKPHEVIGKYVDKTEPSLLVLGKLGIHADDELDIGGNAEHLLEDAGCAVLLSQREHVPPVERIARATTSWTHQAEERMERIPEFVRGMARLAILRYAQERGHTVITESIVAAATDKLCPAGHGTSAEGGAGPGQAADGLRPRWSPEATELAATIDDETLRESVRLRAEKKARQSSVGVVAAEHVRAFLGEGASAPRRRCPFHPAGGAGSR